MADTHRRRVVLEPPTEKIPAHESLLRNGTHSRGGGLIELFDWEKTWFKTDMPKPCAPAPAGGAGWGREVCQLEAMGYEVVALNRP